ncbi:hypothetical protein ADENT20671_0006 [Actinomyces denticolens]|uniref:DUF4190 domain-containing protein n=1 Tax=Actinomyces denticolens TaxID=52767 RepID=UPI0009D3A525|nr:DUF4190 domain-containing protein [Actinomyces denticolens]GAV93266.1 hypothetical protein ADENT20671_0006 [Actinomyces denticolens]
MSNYPDPSDPQIPGNGMPQYPGQGVNPYGMPNGFGPDPTGKNWMASLRSSALPHLPVRSLHGDPAIIFGALGMSAAGRGEATNKGMAIAGLVLGVISVALTIYAIATGSLQEAIDSINNAN